MLRCTHNSLLVGLWFLFFQVLGVIAAVPLRIVLGRDHITFNHTPARGSLDLMTGPSGVTMTHMLALSGGNSEGLSPVFELIGVYRSLCYTCIPVHLLPDSLSSLIPLPVSFLRASIPSCRSPLQSISRDLNLRGFTCSLTVLLTRMVHDSRDLICLFY